MRWHVEAADTNTGLDTSITVEALTEADAERLARYNGLLVSKVYKAVPPAAPVVAYHGPAEEEPEPPEHGRLARRARAARVLGVVAGVLGWIALMGAVGLSAYVAMRRGWGDWTDWRAWLPPAVEAAWPIALGGAAALVVGTVLRLLASAALVVRDLARHVTCEGGRSEGGRAWMADPDRRDADPDAGSTSPMAQPAGAREAGVSAAAQ